MLINNFEMLLIKIIIYMFIFLILNNLYQINNMKY